MSPEKLNTTVQRKILFQSESFEVVSIDWNKNSLSEKHNHGWSQCSVLIESGAFENTLELGVKTEIQLLEQGQVLETPIGAHHSMRCLTTSGRTLHVYTPKIIEHTDYGKFKIQSTADFQEELLLSTPTTMNELKKILIHIKDNSVSTKSPYFMNQLFSGIMPQMLLAEELIAQTKSTMATFEASPTFSKIETEIVHSLCQTIGWKKNKCDGISVPGGSAANFMALHCARQKMFPDIKKTGITGQQFSVFVSSEAHYSFKKACAALGIGTNNLVEVPVDQAGRLIPEKLDQLILQQKNNGKIPLLVCATAGTTVLGAFDPLDKISEICKKHSLWLHVDAAWGGPALFSKQLKKLVQGIELANSVTFDAHKLFGASLTCSFFLTQDVGLLLEANDVSGGDYLFHSENPQADHGKKSWQCGRKADAVSFWTIWKSLGTEGLGDFVDKLLNIRDETLDWIKTEPRLELVAAPDFLNICIRVKPSNPEVDSFSWSKKVREDLKNKNLAMVNYSTDQNGDFLRLILANPYLQFNHVKQILQWSLEVK